jgi:alkylhydroperoxidase/carboxymuconolactone decarboxylase family protein YurZ
MEKPQGKKETFLYPEFEYLAEKHPEFYEHFRSIGRYSIEKGKFLDLKTKLLIPMVILAYRGLDKEVAAHVRRAFGLGMTEDEILEAFLVAMAPGGAPTMHYGIRALMEAKKERSGNK